LPFHTWPKNQPPWQMKELAKIAPSEKRQYNEAVFGHDWGRTRRQDLGMIGAVQYCFLCGMITHDWVSTASCQA
jgi:hypothetical protein